MAVLKVIPRIAQGRPNVAQLRNGPLFNYDAHVQAYRDYLIATFTGKVEVCKDTKPLKMWHHWQADYRSATPKGIVLVAKRGTARWIQAGREYPVAKTFRGTL